MFNIILTASLKGNILPILNWNCVPLFSCETIVLFKKM